MKTICDDLDDEDADAMDALHQWLADEQPTQPVTVHLEYAPDGSVTVTPEDES
jgi:hypothetical protein